MTTKQLAKMILDNIYKVTGIIVTVGIGTNLYLEKIALDITAKHSSDNTGYLDEDLYKKSLWYHTPLTNFWMIGKGTADRLWRIGIVDMYGIAHCPEKILYNIFGVNAEYLIDHAWGREPVVIKDIKAYKPKENSISNSLILFEDYNYKDAFIILKEMVESNVLSLMEKHLVTNHISLCIGYSKDVTRSSRVSRKISNTTNLYKISLEEFTLLYNKNVNPNYPIRQIATTDSFRKC